MSNGKEIYVITSTAIKETGTVSWAWMMKDGIPFSKFGNISGTFGLLLLKSKDANHFDPWKWADSEDKRPHSDEVLRWNVNVFQSDGKGFLMGCGVDADPKGEGLKKLVEELPECVLLMHRAPFDMFKAAAEELGFNVGVYHFDGELATS